MLIALALGWVFNKMDLTPFGKNAVVVVGLFVLYSYLGGFNYPVITGVITLVISLILAFKFSIGKDEDMDVMGAMVINDRGFFTSSESVKPPNTQNCIAYFEKRIDFEHTRKHLSKALFKYRRFSSIAVIKPKQSNKVWNTQWIKCDMSDANISDKIITYNKVNNNNELYDIIDQLCNVRLPPYLPQWRVHCIDNLNGESAWLWRVSHGLADGLRLVPLAQQMFEDLDGNPIAKTMQSQSQSQSKNKKVIGLNAKNAKLYYDTRGECTINKNSDECDECDDKKRNNQFNQFSKLLRLGKKYYQLFNPIKLFLDIKSINDMLKGPFDTISPFKPDYNIHCPKLQKIFRPKIYKSQIDNETRDYMPLSFVKELKKHYNVTVNDVLTALFAGALRDYILSQNNDYFKKQDMKSYRVKFFLQFI